MLKYCLIAGFATMFLMSCGSGADNGSTDAETTLISHTAQNNVVGQEVALLWNNYLRLRDALVKANANDAGKWALAMNLAAQNFPTDSLDEEAKIRWTRQQKDIERDALAITTSSIEEQRAAFELLSKTMYQLITELGLPAGTYVYQQHCPMAFNDRGAWWLSEQPDIVNPYFGDKMLTCGVVKESIEFN